MAARRSLSRLREALDYPEAIDERISEGSQGESAYQVAVDNGFVGTEEEWVASLKGDPGDPGDAGAPGQSAYELAVAEGFVGTEDAWLASLVGPAGPSGTGASSTSADWPRFLNDGTGFTAERIITKANVARLAAVDRYPKTVATGLAAQPAIANGLLYVGGTDGIMRAFAVAGDLGDGWSTDLGKPGGIWSTPLVADVVLPADTAPRSVLFIGAGGDDAAEKTTVFALDALTGDFLWCTPIGLPPGSRIWASPVQSEDFILVGVASVDDSPLVQGTVSKLDMATGTLFDTYMVVPPEHIGGGVWGSVAVDPDDGSFFFTSGDDDGDPDAPQPLALALLHVSSDFITIDLWHNTAAEGLDEDFGSTPTLFETSTGTKLVGVSSKDGNFYVFARDDLGAGPVATLPICAGGADPTAGAGAISPAAWDGYSLYVAGGTTTISGDPFNGSVRRYDPDDLSGPVWEHGLAGPVVGPVVAADGLVVVASGGAITVLDSLTGTLLLGYNGTEGETFLAAPTIAHGVLYAASTDWTSSTLYALSPLSELLADQVGGGGGGASGGPLGEIGPEDIGLLGWNMPISSAGLSYGLVDGYVFLQKLSLRDALAEINALAEFCTSPANPTTVIASLWSLSGTLATLEAEMDGHPLIADYLIQVAALAATHELTGDILRGIYCTGGSMPEIARASATHTGRGTGPGIDKRANTFVFLGSVASMPSTLDLSSCSSLAEWPFAGIA